MKKWKVAGGKWRVDFYLLFFLYTFFKKKNIFYFSIQKNEKHPPPPATRHPMSYGLIIMSIYIYYSYLLW